MVARRKFLSLFFAVLLAAAFSAAAFAAGPLPFNGENPVKTIAKELSPAVVNIDVESVVRESFGGLENDPIFRRFFGEEFRRFSRSVPMKGRGSGFIVSKEGQILTNNHVVEGADKITVTLSSGKTYSAKVLGRDPTFDLAIIKIDGEAKEEFPVIEMGDSDAIEVGDWVVAIGNPYGLEHTVTVGVISAKNRSIHAQNVNFDGFLQTDAAINPGNSGGPLIGFDGKVVGINTAILPYAQGLGFAVPVNMAKQIMNDLVEFGSVKRGYLGILVQTLSDEMKEAFGIDVEEGVVVADIVAGEAAEKSGIERGDVITQVNGESIKNPSALTNKIRSFAPGTKIKVNVVRDNKPMTIDIELGVMPDTGASNSGRGVSALARLGLTVAPISKELQRKYDIDKGLAITKVDQGSEAQTIGLAVGDIIFEVNNQKVNTIDDLNKAVNERRTLALLVWRDGNTFYVPMRLPR